MTRRADSFSPKVAQKRSEVLYSSSIILADSMRFLFFVSATPILLWSIEYQKFMLDAFMIKILFNLSVLELGVIVISHLLDLGIKLILSSLQELLEHLLYFTLVMQKNTQVKRE
jgi:hypothetical protein